MPAETDIPTGKRDAIAQRLRERIISGSLTAGSKLPSRSELGREFGVSTPTVQAALDELKLDGLVVGRKGAGNYAAKCPPHLFRYVLAFGGIDKNPISWGGFAKTLSQALRTGRYEGPDGKQIEAMYDIDHPDSSPSRLKLEREVKRGCVAGLILLSTPQHLNDSPIVCAPGIPRVLVGSQPYAAMPIIRQDREAFFSMAVAHLLKRGRRRIALLANTPGPVATTNLFRDTLSKRGLSVPPQWIQFSPHYVPEAVKQTMHLLLSGFADERPDGVIISDDSLIEAASAGIVASGVSVPGELEIVSHCNFPPPGSPVLPMTRIGYDAPHLLRVCLELLDAQRAGRAVPMITELSPLTEQEWESHADAIEES